MNIFPKIAIVHCSMFNCHLADQRVSYCYPFCMETKLPNTVSLEFVEALYADYLRDPEAVPPDWRQYFQGLSEGNGFSKGQSLTPTFKSGSIFNPPAAAGNGTAVEEATGAILQERVHQLIRNYRVRGHMAAQPDPLGLPRAMPPGLDLEFY